MISGTGNHCLDPLATARRCGTTLVWLAVVSLGTTTLLAQDEPKITGSYQLESGTRQGWLVVTVNIPAGCHIYALTQKGSPPPTRLKVAESGSFELVDKFVANKPPKVIEHDPVFEQRVEKHDAGIVKFMAPIRISEDANPEAVSIDLKFHGQICSGSGCKPLFNRPVATAFAGYYQPAPQDDSRNPVP